MLPLYNLSPSLAMAGEHRKRHTLRAHNQEGDSDWLNPLSLGTLSASAYVENLAYKSTCLINYQTHQIDLNISSLKWCSVINCNWCVLLCIS